MKFFIAFVLGAIAGSLANCWIWRLPREKSVITPPSHCPKCGHRLGLLDLIPVASYLWLGGRCRWCGEPISFRYLLVELILAGLFVITVGVFENPLEVIFYSLIAIVFVVLAFIDWEHQILPDSLTFLAAGLGFVYQLLKMPGQINLAVFSAIGAGLFMLILGFISGLIWRQETLGGGDVKLAAAFGFIFGWPKIVLVLFLSFFVGAAIGLFLMFGLRKSRKDYMPFGPAMIAAAFMTIFWGDFLLAWYYRLMVPL